MAIFLGAGNLCYLRCITKTRHLTCFDFVGSSCLVYFFPFLLAFFASSSCFASKRFGDLYGRLDVFLFGLNAIILVMVTSI